MTMAHTDQYRQAYEWGSRVLVSNEEAHRRRTLRYAKHKADARQFVRAELFHGWFVAALNIAGAALVALIITGYIYKRGLEAGREVACQESVCTPRPDPRIRGN